MTGTDAWGNRALHMVLRRNSVLRCNSPVTAHCPVLFGPIGDRPNHLARVRVATAVGGVWGRWEKCPCCVLIRTLAPSHMGHTNGGLYAPCLFCGALSPGMLTWLLNLLDSTFVAIGRSAVASFRPGETRV